MSKKVHSLSIDPEIVTYYTLKYWLCALFNIAYTDRCALSTAKSNWFRYKMLTPQSSIKNLCNGTKLILYLQTAKNQTLLHISMLSGTHNSIYLNQNHNDLKYYLKSMQYNISTSLPTYLHYIPAFGKLIPILKILINKNQSIFDLKQKLATMLKLDANTINETQLLTIPNVNKQWNWQALTDDIGIHQLNIEKTESLDHSEGYTLLFEEVNQHHINKIPIHMLLQCALEERKQHLGLLYVSPSISKNELLQLIFKDDYDMTGYRFVLRDYETNTWKKFNDNMILYPYAILGCITENMNIDTLMDTFDKSCKQRLDDNKQVHN